MKSKRIISNLIAYLESQLDGLGIRVADAQDVSALSLPCVAVAVSSLESYAASMKNVHRAEITVSIRQHVGDDDTQDMPAAIGDIVESALCDYSAAKSYVAGCDFWQYGGATDEWDGSILETTHSVSAVVR
jgi:hypothetical protein